MLLRVGVATALVASVGATVTLKPASNIEAQFNEYITQYDKQYRYGMMP